MNDVVEIVGRRTENVVVDLAKRKLEGTDEVLALSFVGRQSGQEPDE